MMTACLKSVTQVLASNQISLAPQSHSSLLGQVERILSAAMRAIANQTNSVTLDSAQTSEWDLSIQIALQTMTVPILVSAMKTLSVSHSPLLDQVERIHSAAMTAIANQINSVTQGSVQTLEWDFSFQDKKETLVK